jgi:anti-sigma regulatory factor (Ser/Thr protein kinase)
VPVPIGPSAISTEADAALSTEADAALSQEPAAASAPALPPRLNVGATVWDAFGPLKPVLLGETERRFRFRGLPQAVGAARRALREWEHHFEPDLFYDLSLCVSELVTKSVQRAEPTSRDEIELAVSRHQELVRAEVIEYRHASVVTQPAVMDGGDWGMFIVDRVADRWGVDRSVGTRLWCEIELSGDGRSRDGFRLGGNPPGIRL